MTTSQDSLEEGKTSYSVGPVVLLWAAPISTHSNTSHLGLIVRVVGNKVWQRVVLLPGRSLSPLHHEIAEIVLQ